MDDSLYTSYKIYELITEEGVSENKLKTFGVKIKLHVLLPLKILQKHANSTDIAMNIKKQEHA